MFDLTNIPTLVDHIQITFCSWRNQNCWENYIKCVVRSQKLHQSIKFWDLKWIKLEGEYILFLFIFYLLWGWLVWKVFHFNLDLVQSVASSSFSYFNYSIDYNDNQYEPNSCSSNNHYQSVMIFFLIMTNYLFIIIYCIIMWKLIFSGEIYF